jgi:hypothetical protein
MLFPGESERGCPRLPPAMWVCPRLPRAAPAVPSTFDGDSVDAADVDRAPSSAATALAPMAEVWQRLLAEHVPDRQGRRVGCQWQTRSADRWPCNLYSLAAAAEQVATTSTTPGR